METNYVCFCTLSTGTKHKLTLETYNQVLQAEKDDFISLPNGTVFKNSAVMEIQDIKDYPEDEKSYSYGQPYPTLPKGKDRGYKGVIDLATDVTHIEALARGLKKAKEKFTEPTLQIDYFLDQCRIQYKKIKSGFYAR